MNALVGIRSNSTGLLSPTPEQRASVAQKLEETAAARAGSVQIQAASAGRAVATVQGATDIREGVEDELGKEAFLQLLVLQLQNQDPLAPTDSTSMLAQLAQFSALEAQTNLNESFEALSSNVDQLNFISAAQLVGKTVTGVTRDGQLHTGVVNSVHLDGSLVVLSVDGVLLSMAGIIGIQDGAAAGTETDGEDGG